MRQEGLESFTASKAIGHATDKYTKQAYFKTTQKNFPLLIADRP